MLGPSRRSLLRSGGRTLRRPRRYLAFIFRTRIIRALHVGPSPFWGAVPLYEGTGPSSRTLISLSVVAGLVGFPIVFRAALPNAASRQRRLPSHGLAARPELHQSQNSF